MHMITNKKLTYSLPVVCWSLLLPAGYSLVAVCRFLMGVASLAVEHRL